MSPRADERYPKCARVRRRREYLEIQRRGRAVHGAAFLCLVHHREGGGRARLGITTTRRFGSAVVRNRTRRQVREAFRRGALAAPEGVDLVVIAKRSAAGLGSDAVRADLARIGRRVRRLLERST